MTRKIIIAVLSAAELLLLHMCGGYIHRAMTGAVLVGEYDAHFVGYYILSIPFFAGLAVCSVFLACFIVKEIKVTKNNKTINKK